MIVTLRSKGGQTKAVIEGVDYTIINGEIHFKQDAFGGTFQLEDVHVEYEEPVVVLANPTEFDESHIMTRKLTVPEQNAILGRLFGIYVENDCMYDEEGDRVMRNLNLDTLAGIFEYLRFVSKESGRDLARNEIKTALGL